MSDESTQYQLISEDEMKNLLAFVQHQVPLGDDLAARLKTYTPSQKAVVGANFLLLLETEMLKGWVLPKNGSHYGSAVLAAKVVGCSSSTVERALSVKRTNEDAFENIACGRSRVQTEYDRYCRTGEIPKHRPRLSSRNAKSIKERMIRALSQVRGICSWLPDDADALRIILPPDEIETWAYMARTAAHALITFARHLEQE